MRFHASILCRRALIQVCIAADYVNAITGQTKNACRPLLGSAWDPAFRSTTIICILFPFYHVYILLDILKVVSKLFGHRNLSDSTCIAIHSCSNCMWQYCSLSHFSAIIKFIEIVSNYLFNVAPRLFLLSFCSLTLNNNMFICYSPKTQVTMLS